MSRLGFLVRGSHFEGGVEAIAQSCALPNLEAEGIFTHFAVSDVDDEGSEAYTRQQFDVFMRVIGVLAERGRRFPIRHCHRYPGGPWADLRHPPLCQQRRPGPVSGDVSGYGAARYCFVRCRR